MAATRQEAERAFDHFLTLYRPKYPKAATATIRDTELRLDPMPQRRRPLHGRSIRPEPLTLRLPWR